MTVPTPLHEGAPDLSYIESAARMLAPHVRPGCLVVLESTTYPGTTEQLFVPILEAGSGLIAGLDFGVGYSPERIDPGNRTWDLETTPKLVSGIDAGVAGPHRRVLLDLRPDHRAGVRPAGRPSWPSCWRTPSGT